jgi:hypothetical protein
MEDFIDVFLVILLLAVVVFSGLLIFLLLKNPPLAYFLMGLFSLGITAGIGVWVRKVYRKKRMGSYYQMFMTISQSRKEIFRSIKKSDRPLKTTLTPLFPKIDTLCVEAQQCIWKIQDIEKNLASFETKQHLAYQHQPSSPENIGITGMIQSNQKYYKNIQSVKSSKTQYIRQLQRIIQFLQELNSQILALRYSHGSPEMGNSIMETIDDLLIRMKALEEIK